MAQHVQLKASIGFNGKVVNGLSLTPDANYLVCPSGSALIVRNLPTNEQTLLRGHDCTVTCAAISPSGRYLASGQQTYKGFVADVILWDLQWHRERGRLRLHKDSIQDISFSCYESYIATLGAKDADDLVIWDVETGAPICAAPPQGGPAVCVRFFNKSETQFLTGGLFHVKIWQLDYANKKLKAEECNLGKLRRIIQCAHISFDDSAAYFGTSSGDILHVALSRGLLKQTGPMPRRLPEGVTSISQLPDRTLLVGTGQGAVVHLSDTLVSKNVCNVLGRVTSIFVSPDPRYFYVGTSLGNLYYTDVDSLKPKLKLTSHAGPINSVVFPEHSSSVFATASIDDVRVWDTWACRELARFGVPQVECFCVAFMPDDSSIISGWSDGAIRLLLPESGSLFCTINDAHRDGTTSIAIAHESKRIVSGGMTGDVRVWSLEEEPPKMLASVKEHCGRVWSLKLRRSDTHAVTASADGSIIMWNLNTYTSVLSLVETTIFKALEFYRDDLHLLATGSDRKVHFIDTYDGAEMRVLDASESGDVNCLAVTRDGKYFLSGGNDKALKLWNFATGECVWTGTAHADSITSCCVSPDQTTIVTGDDKGAIFLWKFAHFIKDDTHKTFVLGT